MAILPSRPFSAFATFEGLERHKCTIEEREEYEPHLREGTIVYAGVDYEKILRQAVGKAWAGGMYPVSAVLASKEILGVYRPGDHGSTFGGNPLGCALARTALRVLVEEDMVERSSKLGAYFLQKLKTLSGSAVKEVRGRGLWIGIKLHNVARPYCEALKETWRPLE